MRPNVVIPGSTRNLIRKHLGGTGETSVKEHKVVIPGVTRNLNTKLLGGTRKKVVSKNPKAPQMQSAPPFAVSSLAS